MSCIIQHTPEELANLPTKKLADILNKQYVFGANCDYCMHVPECLEWRNKNKQLINAIFVMRLQEQEEFAPFV